VRNDLEAGVATRRPRRLAGVGSELKEWLAGFPVQPGIECTRRGSHRANRGARDQAAPRLDILIESGAGEVVRLGRARSRRPAWQRHGTIPNQALSVSIWSRWRPPVHRSSESVAAIATALAKAQTELINPEKAMVGAVYNNRSERPQSFRYASLSSVSVVFRPRSGAPGQRDRPMAADRRFGCSGDR
jgi:hypothetical protein